MLASVELGPIGLLLEVSVFGATVFFMWCKESREWV